MIEVDVKCRNLLCGHTMKSRLPCNSVTELIKILFRNNKTLICHNKYCMLVHNKSRLPDFYIVSRSSEHYTPPIRLPSDNV